MEELGYKNLVVWKKAHCNSLTVLKLIHKLPVRFSGICRQLMLSVTSVGANIAEGSGGYKSKEFARFLNIALRSAFETDNWLQLIKDLKLLSEQETIIDIEERNIEVIKMLITLIKKEEAKNK